MASTPRAYNSVMCTTTFSSTNLSITKTSASTRLILASSTCSTITSSASTILEFWHHQWQADLHQQHMHHPCQLQLLPTLPILLGSQDLQR